MPTEQEIRKMITDQTLIPAEPWDLFLSDNGNNKIINHGLTVYIESFYSGNIESYTLYENHEIHSWGKLTARLLPWLEAGKIWIHKTEREVTIVNSPEYQKEKKKRKKIEKTGAHIELIKDAII